MLWPVEPVTRAAASLSEVCLCCLLSSCDQVCNCRFLARRLDAGSLHAVRAEPDFFALSCGGSLLPRRVHADSTALAVEVLILTTRDAAYTTRHTPAAAGVILVAVERALSVCLVVITWFWPGVCISSVGCARHLRADFSSDGPRSSHLGFWWRWHGVSSVTSERVAPAGYCIVASLMLP